VSATRPERPQDVPGVAPPDRNHRRDITTGWKGWKSWRGWKRWKGIPGEKVITGLSLPGETSLSRHLLGTRLVKCGRTS